MSPEGKTNGICDCVFPGEGCEGMGWRRGASRGPRRSIICSVKGLTARPKQPRAVWCCRWSLPQALVCSGGHLQREGRCTGNVTSYRVAEKCTS